MQTKQVPTSEKTTKQDGFEGKETKKGTQNKGMTKPINT